MKSSFLYKAYGLIRTRLNGAIFTSIKKPALVSGLTQVLLACFKMLAWVRVFTMHLGFHSDYLLYRWERVQACASALRKERLLE